MIINLKHQTTKNIVSKILSKALSKKFGSIDVNVNNFALEMGDDVTYLTLSISAPNSDIFKIIEDLTNV